MRKQNGFKVKYNLFQYILLCMICGSLVGALIFLFKFTASSIISLSGEIYSFVRTEPIYLPLLVSGAVLLAFASSVILKYAPDGKGGGIPTAISVLRGLVSFSWVKSLLSMFTSAMITFLVGVPLGNEGPSVQMGTAVGRGCVRIAASKHHAWDKYIMTGGACAGFAAATGAPLTGIFFAFEEAHRRFSPMIFTASAMTAVTASGVMKFLCKLTDTPYNIFYFHASESVPLQYGWIAVVVGIACGALAIILTRCYRVVRKVLNTKLAGVPFVLKISVVFAMVAILGFFSNDFVGSGHHIVDELFESQGVWYLLLLYLVVRSILLLFSNNIGITGGLFVPTLAFGAIAGGLLGTVLTNLELLPAECYSVAVVIGISSVLASFSRTPIMAIAFSLESLGAVNNILPVILGVTAAYVVVERFEAMPFTDVVIEARAEDANHGKSPQFIDIDLTVTENAFIVNKAITDILWPPHCVVTNVHKLKESHHAQGSLISSGDKLSFRFKSYNIKETMEILESYVGKQSVPTVGPGIPLDLNDDIPEI